MRIQLSLDQNTLRFYGDETSTLRVDSDDDIVFAFPVITTDFVTSGQLRVVQAGRSQQYPLVNSQASVPASTLVSGPFTISAVSNLYSTNELEFTAVVSYTGNEMSPIVNKLVHLNENQINIYNEDNSQYIHFIMARYYDGVDLSTKTCRIHWYSPDNNVADYDAVQDRAVVGDNIVFTWLIGNELTQYEGEIQFVVEFIGTDYVWKSKICTFTVENSLADTGGLTPAPTDQWYNSFVVEMDGKVATAEAWANGQKNGTDVPSTDPAYQNNAKYYMEQAADEADRAEDAADHAEEVVDHKAEIDGYYQEMSVGGAEQLISNIVEQDQEPYNFRTAGGSLEIGDRLQEKVVGGTVAWNQLVRNGNFADTSVWTPGPNDTFTTDGNIATYRASDRYHNISQYKSGGCITDHVMLGITNAKSYTNTGIRFYVRCVVSGTVVQTAYSYLTSEFEQHSIVTKMNQYGSLQVLIQDDNASDYGDILIKSIQVFDLTQLFGTEIADYIYSLEQATPGAGVAWFKKYFPKPYYAYNAGQLMSVKALKHITRGFNQWDEEWELGGINYYTGAQTIDNNNIRSKNYIPVIKGATYYIRVPFATASVSFNVIVAGYDVNKNYVKGLRYNTGNATFSISDDNISYIRFCVYSANSINYGNTYKHDICINLHWDGERDGEYEEYVEHVYELDPDLELRGIPKLDAANKLAYDGDTYESDGKVTRKYGIVDLGTLTWQKNSTIGYLYAPLSSCKLAADSSTVPNMLTPLYETDYPAKVVLAQKDKIISVSAQSAQLMVANSAYSDAATFKTAMSGVYLVYELATPTEEQADPYTNPQIVDDFGTEEYVDAGVAAEIPTRDVSIPVGHDSGYQPNLRAKLEMAPDSPGEDGYYIVYHHDGINEYIPLVIPAELPTNPTEDGTYLLKCTVSSGTATLSWESEGE